MKREYLEGLGIEKENIDKIMAENGKDIEGVKTNLSTKETELADTKKLLEDANKEIEGFKGMDVEGIKQAAEDYKIKFEDAEKKSQEQLEVVKFNYELETMARNYKARNTKAVLALLDKESLKESKNRKEDIKKAFETMAEENTFLFDVEETKEETKARFTRPNDKGNSNKGLTKEEFNKMDYSKRVELFNTDKGLYNELAK